MTNSANLPDALIKNIAAYAFVAIEAPEAFAAQLRAWAESAGLLGTVLVANEGLNLFLAGHPSSVDDFLVALRADQRFADLQVKVSASTDVPFTKLKVKVKREIIAFRQDDASPLSSQRAPAASPIDVQRWIAQGHDDSGRRLVMLDTRNREEVAYGSFVDALTLPIDNFTELPEAIASHRDALTDATVVSFCTGGIRCEKAALWMRANGMPDVLQLDGGILGYFEAVGGEGYRGDCFVFDARVALDSNLMPITDANIQVIFDASNPDAETDR